MGVEHHERLRLLPQMLQQQDQGRVLEDLGVVPGMVGVAIIHGRRRIRAGSVDPPRLAVELHDAGRPAMELHGDRVLRRGIGHQVVGPRLGVVLGTVADQVGGMRPPVARVLADTP